ncbi:MAG: hypothetical protein ABMA64_09445, partial [Myxococcota bacterium]
MAEPEQPAVGGDEARHAAVLEPRDPLARGGIERGQVGLAVRADHERPGERDRVEPVVRRIELD